MTTRTEYPDAYDLGVMQVQADTYRRERDTALRMLARVVESYEDFSHDLDTRMGEARALLDEAAS